MRFALIAFTDKAICSAEHIASVLSGEKIFFDKRAESAEAFVAEVFPSADAIIFVGAAGIAVRLIAKHIRSKESDPAVLVVDEKTRFVIPLLSGHLGGANELASTLAVRLGAQSVITTATDLCGVFAADVFANRNELCIDDIRSIKYISAALLRGESVGLISDYPICGSVPNGIIPNSEEADCGIVIAESADQKPFPHTLNLTPKNIVLGIGCRKGIEFAALERFVLSALAEQKLNIKRLSCAASIELKRGEACIEMLAQKYRMESIFFSSEELNAAAGEFTSSEFVKKTVGTDNVCERSAICAGAVELLLRKRTENGMSLAIGQRSVPISFEI